MKILSTLHSAFVASSAVRTPSHSAFVASSAVRTSSPSQSTFNLATRRVGVEALRMSTSGTEFSPDDLGKKYPELLVFDMDACLWNKEMYEMRAMPSDTVRGDLNGRGEGVIGVMSSRDEINLHRGSLIALQEHWDGKYPGMKIAMASSADTPFAEKVGRASLKLLEVVPGVTVWDVCMRDWDGVDVNQIGRQPPLSSNKSRTHFPFLREKTGIRFDRMLFFDDCNWGDHCGQVEQNCKEEDTGKSPATLRTPYGLGEQEWRKGLEAYAKKFDS